ncbi:DegT/DnrJ/EryC1/StrS family aminotransferase [Chamaesiphon minutus]|uniref:Putative PLP-dependent enzyme possibly involved in cell wall biogenesis n=1 Tax=Chamaesiphon minutus (strain ATCC 27169 / PCC 6605) TaxID=1173020 RepID=K9UMQ1_CHAP6|nr:DegT/DnrJ/EryC1/StrS family aminotransferase [Chamaesiphon minutus]AFY95474.1 putative PLP-dependent enzyme possibly involved in cell wall biogenesis [Chamaesiphon minutus PCC 6605]
MKVYPRLALDITFKDLSFNLLSPCLFADRQTIIGSIHSYWQTSKEILVSLCVRTSFDLLLKSLELPAGSEILMSAVNIMHMEEIVKQHDCIPIPIDLDLATLAPSIEVLERSISPQSRILVIAHLFGAIIDLDPYVDLCKSNNILLVEDCAQSFDGWRYLGHPEADLSLFSFGPIKSCTALGGAITLVRDKDLAEKMQIIESHYPLKSELWFTKRTLKYLCLKFLSIPQIFGILLACLKRLNIDLDRSIGSLTRGFSSGDIQSQLQYRPPIGMLRLLQRRFENLDLSRFDRRQQAARNFLTLWERSNFYPGYKATRHSYWVMPIMTKDPQLLMHRLRAAGFDPTTGATSLKAIGSGAIQAERLINSILYLPISASLPATEIDRLVRSISLAKIGSLEDASKDVA